MWNKPTAKQLAALPKLYSTEKVSINDKKIVMHFFIGGTDMFIAEYDPEERLFFGYTILNQDLENAEWGYISFDELMRIKSGFVEIDRDLHFKPDTFRHVMQDYFLTHKEQRGAPGADKVAKSLDDQTKTELKDHPQLSKKEAKVIAKQEIAKDQELEFKDFNAKQKRGITLFGKMSADQMHKIMKFYEQKTSKSATNINNKGDFYSFVADNKNAFEAIEAVEKHEKKKEKFGYDVDDPFDRDIVLDQPYSQLNAKGRKAKKKRDLRNEAQEVEAKRSPASQARDEKMHNKQTLPLTKENFEKWKANPDQYDLQGIDTVKKLVRAFHAAKPFRITPQPKEVSYTQEDLEKARRYLKDHNYLYKENGKYIELQAEIARAIHAGIDPQMIDYAAHLSDDISLSESLSNEQEWELLESRGYK